MAISGGGRCNLTNSFASIKSLEKAYPRGAHLMKRLLKEFGQRDVFSWFEREGVPLITQDDGCVFPRSENALDIVSTLKKLLCQEGVNLKLGHRLLKIEEFKEKKFLLHFSNDSNPEDADYVLIATGGSLKPALLDMFSSFGHEISRPVASLFSFSIDDKELSSLMGIVVDDASARIVGKNIKATGALLITDWGLSGPAILKLSSYAARELFQADYKAKIAINWMGSLNEKQIMEVLLEIQKNNPRKLLTSVYPECLVFRLWQYLLLKSNIKTQKTWQELGQKALRTLALRLSFDEYQISGKNKYKGEFVTAGGISLSGINPSSLESKKIEHLFFAGEILDVDGITGGFNLQAAWTTGYVAAKAIALDINKAT